MMYLGLRTRSTMMTVGAKLALGRCRAVVAGSLLWLIVRLLAPMALFGGLLWLYGGLQHVWLAVDLGYLWSLLRWAQRQMFGRFRELATQPYTIDTAPNSSSW